MTKPELQASERAVKAATEIRGLSSSPLPLDDMAQIIETTCHLRELETVAKLARQVSNAAWQTPVETKREYLEVGQATMSELDKTLATLDAAKEGK